MKGSCATVWILSLFHKSRLGSRISYRSETSKCAEICLVNKSFPRNCCSPSRPFFFHNRWFLFSKVFVKAQSLPKDACSTRGRIQKMRGSFKAGILDPKSAHVRRACSRNQERKGAFSSSASLGFTDNSQADTLSLRVQFVNFGAGDSPGSPN